METLNLESLIQDLAFILVLGAIASIVFKLLKQPVVLGYIVAGFLASPHFNLLPNVANEANIEFWAQIGIIVLLFSLGLEFSFKKLINAGASAILTAFIIVSGMMGLGFVVGKMLQFTAVDSIFLGAMLSMSSTTIILKALTDLGMKQRKFVSGVFAVLIVEDLFAVVMMVILSSIAINRTVEGGELLKSVLKLSFFLVMWFTVGVFMIPSIFRRFRRVISDEMMLIIAMGLCFLMAILAVEAGFSMALGAFVMGSILAGTSEAERIERIVNPVKDLFGAVFFISVGMMVNPDIIVQYAGTISLLTVVVIVGMILFGTFGMLATGKPLREAMESGFCLTQIGEFSFIIATLGMSLGVLDYTIYPIIVAVSVVTTFFTPFFIKAATPSYGFVLRILPKSWTVLLNGYSKNAEQSEVSESRRIWGSIMKRYFIRLVLYTVVLITSILLLRTYFMPFITERFAAPWGTVAGVAVCLAVVAPFLFGIIFPTIRPVERERLVELSGRVSYVPMAIMLIVGLIIAMANTMSMLYGYVPTALSLIITILMFLALGLLLRPLLKRRLTILEHRFVSNINERENRRTGKNNTLVSDLHLAYMRVGYGCPFVGERLKNADLRRKYGVTVINIQRNSVIYPVPKSDTRIFPGDVVGVIGTDEQIQQLLPLVEAQAQAGDVGAQAAEFMHFAIGEHSPIVGKTLLEARLREDYASLLVSVQRGEDDFITPTPDLTFLAGDIIWIVGDPKLLTKLK